MKDFYYHKDASAERAKLHGLNKELMDIWNNFNSKIFTNGTLPIKTKELIAVAVAHTTRCPYCIAGHTRAARKADATEEEIAEAIFVAVALNAGASMAHSNISMQTLEEEKET